MIYVFATSFIFFSVIICWMYLHFRKKIHNIEVELKRHLNFLIKVKHDLPLMGQQLYYLQDQILPPPDKELN